MAFWGGSRLATEGKAKKIVVPYDVARIDCSAYELTLGAEAYVTPKYGDDLRKNTKELLKPAESEKIGDNNCTKGGGTVIIPPGQFALLLTEEIVSIPDDAMGFISLKRDPKFRGLINVSGFHVDPGFKGRLIFSAYNAGPSAIPLDRGDRLFQLWIADLSGEVVAKYTRSTPGFANIPSEFVAKVSRERHSLQALSERVDSLANQVRVYTTVVGGIVGAIALALSIVTAAQKFGWFDKVDGPQAKQAVATESAPFEGIPPTEAVKSKVPASQPMPTHS